MGRNYKDMRDGLEPLIGKIIKQVFINNDKTQLKIECDDGTHYFQVDSDCCSIGWIEHINLQPYLSAKVEKVENPSMDAIMASKQDSDKVYASLAFGKGNLLLGVEYRNSSNGYYGSSMYENEGEIILSKEDKWTNLNESF